MTLRAAIYSRSASVPQDADSHPNQIAECHRYLEKQGWLLAGAYDDAGISGVSEVTTRPGYQRLMRDAEAGAFDIVVIETTDRLSRNLEDVTRCYNQLTFRGIKLHTPIHGEITLMPAQFFGQLSQGRKAKSAAKIRARPTELNTRR